MSKKNTELVPADEPTSLEAVQQAVEFVAQGKPLSVQFVTALSRQLTNLQERADLVQLAVDNHQMKRLSDTFQHISEVEDYFFGQSPTELKRTLATMESKDVVRLLQMLYKEANALARYHKQVAEEAQLTASPDAIQDLTVPLDETQKQAQKQGLRLGTEGRAKVQDFLNGLMREAQVIETKENNDTTEKAS